MVNIVETKINQNNEGEDVLSAATEVVNMFDQANTAHAIEELGSRGVLLKGAIADLRKILNFDTKRTCLDSEEVGE